MTMEILATNLYDLIKESGFNGLHMDVIRKIAIQVLHALKDLKANDIIHCDLKPENILLKSKN